MAESELTPAIYISYAWNQESEAIAESIEAEFQKRGVRIIRDKNDLGYKGRIKEFMEQIGRGKYVILVISNKYLRSENCMFELLHIFKNQDFYERIFPVVLDEVKIAKATDRLDLLKYWESEAKNLDHRIRELEGLANIQGVAEDLNLYTEIRNNISRLTNILKDINTLNAELHINSDFKQLCDLVQNKMKSELKDERTTTLKKGIVVLVAALAIFLAFLGINKNDFFKKDRDLRDSIDMAKVRHDSIQDLRKKDSLAEIEKKEKETKNKKEETIVSNKTYDVELVVPSSMTNARVLVDNKPAEILERNLIFIKIRLKKKNSSHHFEVKDGGDSCFTDQLIAKDGMRLTLCD